MPDTDTMADTDTRARQLPAAETPDAETLAGRTASARDADAQVAEAAERERCETVEVVVPAWELTALTRAAAAQQVTLADFMATAATYAALCRLELFDEIDQHADIVALLEAIPEKPPRTSCEVNEMYEKYGQVSPETIAVLEDPDTRPGDIPFQEHDETVAVRLTHDQLDVLRRATYVAGCELRGYILGNADFVAMRRLGLIETTRVYPEEAELYARLCETPADELARLREVTPETAAVSER